jgi:hypothetical protein
MIATMPRFSVVVPTRDRPDLLTFCLESLAAQTFDDFEVIVSDSPTLRSSQSVFERWAGSHWRYVRREVPVPMHENFELGCSGAKGEYVAVLIDKTLLHPTALEVADRALGANCDVDIVTWRNEGYNPIDEAHNPGRGRSGPSGVFSEPSFYDPAAELARRFANAGRRGSDPIHYVRGKIVFGAYSRGLLDRVRDATGRVFHALAPDYTSMVPACVLSKRALDLGRPLLLSYHSQRSNGRRQSIDPAHARAFIEAIEPNIIDALPIPGLYASTHNVVAYDLVSSAARCPMGTTPELDLAALARRAREDLDAIPWRDPTERDRQYAILESAEADLGLVPLDASPRARTSPKAALAEVIARMPAVERLVLKLYGRSQIYTSPVEAARAIDRYYASKTVRTR